MSESIADFVHAQTQAKIEAGEELQAEIAFAAELRGQLEAAEKNVADLRKKALKSGWTENQLRQANLVPRKKSAAKASQSRQNAASAGSQSTSDSATNFG